MYLQASTASLPHHPLGTTFATARALGLDGVQVTLTARLVRRGTARLLRLAERHAVPVRSIALNPGGSGLLDLDGALRVAAFASALPDCEVVSLPAPSASAAPGGLSDYLRLVEAFGEALPSDVQLTLVNAPGGGAGPAGPLDNFPQLRRIVEEWDLGFTYDTSHAASAGWVITEPLPRMGARLHNVHLADFRQRTAAGRQRAIPLLPDGVQPWQLHRAPGDGVLPLRAFLRLLLRRKYEGLVTLDLRPRGWGAWWPGLALESLAASVAFCRATVRDYTPSRTDRQERPVRATTNDD